MDVPDIWAIIKLRLGLKDDELQPLMETYIEEIGNRIMHYCSVSTVPPGLKLVWVSMTIDAVRIDQPNIDEVADTAGRGETIKIGDTSTSPSNASGGLTNVSKSSIDAVVLNYRVDLNRYRRMRW
ncbi:DNA-packaging protein [Paenibacillus selenitireducens]|uniref:DNA-packaging protein n=1 Tax=Paenibacillus selenitireducens TaxID=1324314 RepID=A0A1T2X9P6_9BACL|nr:DNA-packaging protein [Paenibacillus selenitireducens]OPA76627.1 DNA-packaging protein [Paenibacillus selenitireducens]